MTGDKKPTCLATFNSYLKGSNLRFFFAKIFVPNHAFIVTHLFKLCVPCLIMSRLWTFEKNEVSSNGNGWSFLQFLSPLDLQSHYDCEENVTYFAHLWMTFCLVLNRFEISLKWMFWPFFECDFKEWILLRGEIKDNFGQKWTKNGPKMVQKWSKNGPKMDQKWTKMYSNPTKNEKYQNKYLFLCIFLWQQVLFLITAGQGWRTS